MCVVPNGMRLAAAEDTEPNCVVRCIGNGSQWPRMGRELLQSSATFRNSIDICAKALSPYGIDLLAAYEAEEGFGDARTAAVGLASIQVGMRTLDRSTFDSTMTLPNKKSALAYDKACVPMRLSRWSNPHC